jgi:hypothetical protein
LPALPLLHQRRDLRRVHALGELDLAPADRYDVPRHGSGRSAFGPDLLAERLLVEAEHERRQRHVGSGAQRRRRHGRDAFAIRDLDLHLGVHAGLQQPATIGDLDEHGELRDVLLDERLRLDLQHFAIERLIRVRGDGHARAHAGLDLADVGFVDARAHLDDGEIGHLHERRAAADVLRRRRDDRAGLDRLLDDRARDRRAHVGVLERDARILDGNFAPTTCDSAFANSSCVTS